MSSVRVLVVHSQDEDTEKLLTKIIKLHDKNGPFDICLLLGDVAESVLKLSTDAKDNLVKEVGSRLPIYIFDECILHDRAIPSNFTFLKGFGVHEFDNGIQICYCTLPSSELSKEDKDTILGKFKEVVHADLLVTREWSRTLAEQENIFDDGNEVIDEINKLVRPSYHFSYGQDKEFFELKPFLWKESDFSTRFLNIASFNSGKKWAYAFELNPLKPSSITDKKSLQDNPYERIITTTKKRQRDLGTSTEDNQSDIQQKKNKIVLPTSCHFCFSNPNIEDHMIVAIGSHAYLTIAKGPLTQPNAEMNFSGHCILVPIEHKPKLSQYISSEGVERELHQFEKSIVDMNYKNFDMCTIIFNIESEKSIHFHEQIFPIPKYYIMKFQEALNRQLYMNNERYANNTKLEFLKFNSASDPEYLKIVDDSTSNYLQFKVIETNNTEPMIYLAKFDPENRIDLQFGRRVIAFMLCLPRRVKWNSPICQQNKSQEENEVKLFQKAYKDFDITSKDNV